MALIETRPAQSPVTDTAVRALQGADGDSSEKQLVDHVVARVLEDHPDGGLLDSRRLAEALLERRGGGDLRQTQDYLQYLLREADHVCGHAVEGGTYRVHADDTCSPECKERWEQATRTVRRAACTSCYLELTVTGRCPMGCDD